MKIGITGHQNLPNQKTWKWVERELKLIISEAISKEKTIGLSSLAVGADQLFARLLLEAGGELHVIIPLEGYEKTFETSKDLSLYKKLLSEAVDVETLSALADDEQAFFAAGKFIAAGCDILIAVWNGKKAQGLGGTADVVHFAQNLNKPIFHIDTDNSLVAKI